MTKKFKIKEVNEENSSFIVEWSYGDNTIEYIHQMPRSENGNVLKGGKLKKWAEENFPKSIMPVSKLYSEKRQKPATVDIDTDINLDEEIIFTPKEVFIDKRNKIHNIHKARVSEVKDGQTGKSYYVNMRSGGGSFQNEATALSLGIVPEDGTVMVQTTDWLLEPMTVDYFLDLYGRVVQFKRKTRKVDHDYIQKLTNIYNSDLSEKEKVDTMNAMEYLVNWPSNVV